MPSKDILQLGNPLLWEKCARVAEPSDNETLSLIRDLSDTLAEFRRATGFGRGIAAPQIGSLKRVIFIRMQTEGFSSPLINPEIIWASDQRMELWDDCFSFPDLMVRVSRAVEVKVSFQDERGQDRIVEARGDLSELLQHEIDHLDGVLALDRAVSPRALSTRAEWERMQR